MLQSPVLKNGRRVLTRAVAAQRHLGAGPCVAIEVVQIRGRWFRFGFAPPFGSLLRSARCFPRREQYLDMPEEGRDELQAGPDIVAGEMRSRQTTGYTERAQLRRLKHLPGAPAFGGTI